MRRLLAFALTFGACECGQEPQLGRLVPVLTLDTDRADFGEVPLGATKRIALVVHNTGTADLEIAGPEVASPFGALLVETTIAPGATTLIDLSFTPTNVDPQSAVLSIASNDAASPALVSLNGRGVEGAVTVRPSVVDFTSTAVGTSRVQEVVVSNLGIVEVPGTIVTESFARPEHFSLSSLASFTVPGSFAIGPRSELILDLEYRPFELGEDRGRIIFEICGERCGLEVQVVGSAAQPIVQIMPAQLDFGGVGLGETHTQQAVVQNSGTHPVMLLSITTAGGPELAADLGGRPLPTELGPGENIGINVLFTPTNAVEFSGEVIVTTNDPLATTVRAGVLGRGEGPLFVVQPEAISFGTQRDMITHRRSLLLINAGSSAVTVQSVSLAGDPELALADLPGLPARIGSGQSIVVNVTFTPTALGEYGGTVTVTSDDPARPQVEVPVLAGLTDRLCELRYDPDRINFGIIPPSFVRKKGTTLTNVGADDCTLGSGAFRAPLDPYLRLVGSPFPVELLPGQSTTLQFEYAPTEAVESKGNFVILTDDPVFPERHVTLLGSAEGYVDIFTVPESVDFGSVRPTCNAGDREIRIFNSGTVDVEVSSIVLTASTAEISIAQTVAAPFALRAGTSTPFTVGYSAVDLGPDQGEVEIEIRDLPFPLVVPLQGAGDNNPRIEDQFRQNESRSVDVLFVIDDSCSMTDEQSALAANFEEFIEQATMRQIDIQIGITTTTVLPVPGELVGPILTNSTPDLEGEFQRQASVGSTGSGVEQGLDAMQGALNLAYGNVGANAGLIRNDAALAIIIVSDEDDQSFLPPSSYFNDLRTRALNGYTTAVVTGGPVGCTSAISGAAPAPRYEDFANLTGGLSESICRDWASTLSNIGNSAFGLRRVFMLSKAVDMSQPIRVTVDGSEVSSSLWTYDPATGMLIFDSAPAEGSDIRIEYTPQC